MHRRREKDCALTAFMCDSDDVVTVCYVNFIDYHTLRVGGLVFAGVVVFLSIILLAGESSAVCVGAGLPVDEPMSNDKTKLNNW